MPLHIIICRHKGIDYIAEREVADCDFATTVRDILNGQVENVMRVLVTESDVPDVSEDVARAMLEREREVDMIPSARAFVGRHVLTPVLA